MAANQSAGHTAEFMNIGRNVVVTLKIGPVETGPTVLVATALNFQNSSEDLVGVTAAGGPVTAADTIADDSCGPDTALTPTAGS